MAEKFHISESGAPAPCGATERACPRGGDAEHYSTQEKAQAAFDLSMAAELLPQAMKAPKLQVAETLDWADTDETRELESSLSRPDTDFGFNWVAGQFGDRKNIRISLAKWDEDETGTLYAVDRAFGETAILARNVDFDHADRVWKQMLSEGHPNTSVDDLLYRLSE